MENKSVTFSQESLGPLGLAPKEKGRLRSASPSGNPALRDVKFCFADPRQKAHHCYLLWSMPHLAHEESYPMQRHSTSFDSIAISNPKLYKDPKTSQESRVFPYYAGYSSEFSNNILSTLKLSRRSIIFDPWNGSGTTTASAFSNGFDCIGFDLNPSMILVAKARLLSTLEHPSLISIAKSLVDQARLTSDSFTTSESDPLLKWFSASSSTLIRNLESKINNLLVSNGSYVKLNNNLAMDLVSPLAAFFYVALFRTARKLLIDFIPSNPTWIKQPKTKLNRKRPSQDTIYTVFVNEVKVLISRKNINEVKFRDVESSVKLQISNAENILLDNDSVDAIISSPPYCTRIDYAVSTAIELALIRCEQSEFDELRRGLTGTSTVERVAPSFDSKWGTTCANFLAHAGIAQMVEQLTCNQ